MASNIQIAILRQGAIDRITAKLKEMGVTIEIPSGKGSTDLQQARLLAAIADGLDKVVVDDDSLPEDFPSRDLLIAAGYETIESLSGVTAGALTAINGIGMTKVAAIVEALK